MSLRQQKSYHSSNRSNDIVLVENHSIQDSDKNSTNRLYMSYPQHKERFQSYPQLIQEFSTILRASGRKHGVVLWCYWDLVSQYDTIIITKHTESTQVYSDYTQKSHEQTQKYSVSHQVFIAVGSENLCLQSWWLCRG